MDYLSRIRAATKSFGALLTTFYQQYSNVGSIHVFHEGKEDPSFYEPFIQNRIMPQQKIYFYLAGNKKTVVKLYEVIPPLYLDEGRTIFLVDRDYQDFIPATNVLSKNFFVTSGYSIENYLVQPRSFVKCLRDYCGISDQEILDASEEAFAAGLSSFYKSMLVFSAFSIYHRRVGNTVYLDNVKVNELVRFTQDLLVTRTVRNLGLIDTKTKVTTLNAMTEMLSIARVLTHKSPETYVRGKYALQYFISCYERLISNLDGSEAIGGARCRSLVPLSVSNAVAVIAPRVNEPIELAGFLDSVLR